MFYSCYKLFHSFQNRLVITGILIQNQHFFNVIYKLSFRKTFRFLIMAVLQK